MDPYHNGGIEEASSGVVSPCAHALSVPRITCYARSLAPHPKPSPGPADNEGTLSSFQPAHGLVVLAVVQAGLRTAEGRSRDA